MLIKSDQQSLSITPERLEKIKYYIEHSKSDNTRRAYASDWREFTLWCERHQRDSMPASVETVAMYLSDLAGNNKLSTIKRKLSSISSAHKFKHQPNPTKHHDIHLMIEGIRRKHGGRQEPKKAILLTVLQDIVNEIDTSAIIGIRDKALILSGFALASRRSELVALNKEDLEFNDLGLDVRIKDNKTAQDDMVKAIVYAHNDYCPVAALQQWLQRANIQEGPLFRSIDRHGNINGRLSSKAVALIIKKYVGRLGLDGDDFSAHSLRSGLATSAAALGMNDTSIIKQTGHKTREMIDRYIREGMRYKNNASSILKYLE